MAKFKYKGFNIEIWKDDLSPYLYLWEAISIKGKIVLGDLEGGELRSMANAKKTIKKWITAYKLKKHDFYPKDIIIKK